MTESPSDTGLYGIVLGKPFGGFPECPYRAALKLSTTPAGAKEYADFGGGVKVPCYKRFGLIGSPTPLGKENIVVHWPYGSAPALAGSTNSAGVRLIGGVVHAVTLSTSGLQLQQRDFDTLKAKFGAPATYQISSQQNRMGAKFDVIQAAWTRPGQVSIVFAGALTDIKSGVVEASTPEGTALQKEALERLNSGKPKL